MTLQRKHIAELITPAKLAEIERHASQLLSNQTNHIWQPTEKQVFELVSQLAVLSIQGYLDGEKNRILRERSKVCDAPTGEAEGDLFGVTEQYEHRSFGDPDFPDGHVYQRRRLPDGKWEQISRGDYIRSSLGQSI